MRRNIIRYIVVAAFGRATINCYHTSVASSRLYPRRDLNRRDLLTLGARARAMPRCDFVSRKLEKFENSPRAISPPPPPRRAAGKRARHPFSVAKREYANRGIQRQYRRDDNRFFSLCLFLSFFFFFGFSFSVTRTRVILGRGGKRGGRDARGGRRNADCERDRTAAAVKYDARIAGGSNYPRR